MPQYCYTDKQLEVEKWINELGHRTLLEKVFGKYCADIYLPDMQAIVEVDGKQHYKAERQKRDKYLAVEFGIVKILHIPTDIKKEQFLTIFEGWINE